MAQSGRGSSQEEAGLRLRSVQDEVRCVVVVASAPAVNLHFTTPRFSPRMKILQTHLPESSISSCLSSDLEPLGDSSECFILTAPRGFCRDYSKSSSCKKLWWRPGFLAFFVNKFILPSSDISSSLRSFLCVDYLLPFSVYRERVSHRRGPISCFSLLSNTSQGFQ